MGSSVHDDFRLLRPRNLAAASMTTDRTSSEMVRGSGAVCSAAKASIPLGLSARTVPSQSACGPPTALPWVERSITQPLRQSGIKPLFYNGFICYRLARVQGYAQASPGCCRDVEGRSKHAGPVPRRGFYFSRAFRSRPLVKLAPVRLANSHCAPRRPRGAQPCDSAFRVVINATARG